MCNFGYLKIQAERREAEIFLKEVSEIVIFRTIYGGWSGPGGPWPLWSPWVRQWVTVQWQSICPIF